MTPTYTGRIVNGEIVLDHGANLPEGARVAVTVLPDDVPLPKNVIDSEDHGDTAASYAQELRRRLKKQKSRDKA